ncbi:fasciclin domain-containing protein [Candidatus Seribacter sulfatis]|uniref:fasciclin domain-containing protein n=1 Tax=Candidatus Seribacter sulfatis TaxID=3381756 RepID=UPI00389A9279
MKKVITSIISLITMASLLVGAPKKDIIDTAVEAGSFKTLVTAVQKAGLVDTLKGEGPFTVFAPTDEAFANFWPETLKNLLKPENKDKLQMLLTYHVVSGKVKAKKARKLESAEPVSGGSLKLSVKDNDLFINSAKVVKADIKASNGIIHVIDGVLIPNVMKNAKKKSNSTNI